MIAYEVESRSHLMPAHHAGQIRRCRVAGFVALEWRPCIVITQRAVAGIERRHTALKRIRTVGSGDSERLAPEVRAEVSALCGLILTVHAEVAVKDHRRADRPRLAHGRDIHVR